MAHNEEWRLLYQGWSQSDKQFSENVTTRQMEKDIPLFHANGVKSHGNIFRRIK